MKIRNQIIRRSLLLLFLSFLIPSLVSAQLISLKTVPVATGDQFLIFPSRNLSMGGVSIALDDSLLDPFVNPAKGSRISGLQLIGSPTTYTIAGDNGSAHTFPMSFLFGSPSWFGGFSIALQQLSNSDIAGNPFPERLSSLANNMYLSTLVGRRIPGTNMAMGGGIFWGNLEGLDGVDLLYAGSQDINQSGYMVAYRLGLYGELAGDKSFELLLLYNRLDMMHRVTYVDRIWGWWRPAMETRVEENFDLTDTYGIYADYVGPIPETNARLGAMFTYNRKSHPKIPNYRIVALPGVLPRDPGDTWAYRAGLGLAITEGEAVLGLDVIYEPIWTDAWAVADTATETVSGKTIPIGGKTIENDFQFSNWLVRMGIRREYKIFEFQLGVQMHSVGYHLKQYDNVQESDREQDERWAEWIPSWGFTVKFPEFEIQYVGRATSGTGRPGQGRRARDDWWLFVDTGASYVGGDFIVAPNEALTLDETRVVTHQISVSMPINKR